MIGVKAKQRHMPAVEEFFQLFKTPWEACRPGKEYAAVIIADENADILSINAGLIMIFGRETSRFDQAAGLASETVYSHKTVQIHGLSLPLYSGLAEFNFAAGDGPAHYVRLSPFTVKIEEKNRTIIRIGYELFEEITALLTEGQTVESAHIPALEHHIEILRRWLIEEKIPFMEIPPVPAGYDFMACLTHDVDFMKISHHLFDHTYWGFIYRAGMGVFFDFLKGKKTFRYVFKNWVTLLSLPLVHLGILKDFWFQFDSYAAMEKDFRSTYFFIPFKNVCGNEYPAKHLNRRGAKYDIRDHKELLQQLLEKGNEVGVHGINAWHNPEDGCQEKKQITDMTGRDNAGVRIHWLFQDAQMFANLEKAGYAYDSTFGYNDTIGFRGGTGQVFRPLGAKNLLELPLHIQDTALFFPAKMGLSEHKAMELCQNIIRSARSFGGVLTILWHQRSLAPERLWGRFYAALLEEMQKNKVWFGTAGDVVKWFEKRRRVSFEDLDLEEGDSLPPLMMRVYNQEYQQDLN